MLPWRIWRGAFFVSCIAGFGVNVVFVCWCFVALVSLVQPAVPLPPPRASSTCAGGGFLILVFGVWWNACCLVGYRDNEVCGCSSLLLFVSLLKCLLLDGVIVIMRCVVVVCCCCSSFFLSLVQPAVPCASQRAHVRTISDRACGGRQLAGNWRGLTSVSFLFFLSSFFSFLFFEDTICLNLVQCSWQAIDEVATYSFFLSFLFFWRELQLECYRTICFEPGMVRTPYFIRKKKKFRTKPEEKTRYKSTKKSPLSQFF